MLVAIWLALARYDLSSYLDYHNRNHIEKWFQAVTMRIDHFRSFQQGSQSSAGRWLRRFRHYYNRHRPNHVRWLNSYRGGN